MNCCFRRPPQMDGPPSPQRIDPHSSIQNNGQQPSASKPRDPQPVRRNLIGWPGAKIDIDTENEVIKGLKVNRRVYGRFTVNAIFKGPEQP